MSPAKPLVVGFGNPLRCDDGLGWQAIERLSQAPELDSDKVEYVTCHQLMPELAEQVARSAFAVFVDACEEGKPGTLRCERVVPDEVAPLAFSHDFVPSTLLAYCKALFGNVPETYVVTLAGESFGYGSELSDTVSKRMPDLLNQVRELLKPYL